MNGPVIEVMNWSQEARRLSDSMYKDDVAWCAGLPLDWSRLDGHTILIPGATGQIGVALIDVLMQRNREWGGFDCRIIAAGRNEAKARARLPYFEDRHFSFLEADISQSGTVVTTEADTVVHLASTTHPKAYATNPVGTIAANVVGLQNLLEGMKDGERCDGRFLFASSVEVYGRNRGDVLRFRENYCGYIDSNTLRAGYPEAKRVGEALCQAYLAQYGVDVVIPRIPRTYGPTLLPSDTKALSQFLQHGINGEDIVLKSEGNQFFSYLYVMDTVSGLLYCLANGDSGAAYNIADAGSDITLRDLARQIADLSGTDVVFELPDAVERRGYSTATTAVMDGGKLKGLGWNPRYTIREGIARTLCMIRN